MTSNTTEPADTLMLPAAQLRPHPGNPRHDLGLTGDFLASARNDGVLVPLRVVPDGLEGWWVIDGHRRLEAARQAGETEVPCAIAAGRDPGASAA
jgi:ParB family chromosome partitioning protein